MQFAGAGWGGSRATERVCNVHRSPSPYTGMPKIDRAFRSYFIPEIGPRGGAGVPPAPPRAYLSFDASPTSRATQDPLFKGKGRLHHNPHPLIHPYAPRRPTPTGAVGPRSSSAGPEARASSPHTRERSRAALPSRARLLLRRLPRLRVGALARAPDAQKEIRWRQGRRRCANGHISAALAHPSWSRLVSASASGGGSFHCRQCASACATAASSAFASRAATSAAARRMDAR